MEKTILIQYYDMRAEAKDLEQRINKIEKQQKSIITDSVQGSSSEYPYTKHSITIEGVQYRYNNKINEYRQLLKQARENLLDLQNRVELYIESIENSRMRRILRYRYIDNLDWVRIAIAMGGKCTADSVRMEHKRFLEEK